MIRQFIILPFAFLAVATLASCDTAEDRAEKHLQSAVSLIEEGDYTRAGLEFRNVFKLVPTHQEARHAFAQMLDSQNNSAASYRQYLLLVEQYPNDTAALKRLSELAVLLNQWEAADRYGRTLEGLVSDDPRVRLVTINLDYRDAVVNQAPAARKAIAEEAESLDSVESDHGLLHRILMDWYVFNGRERDALAQIDRALVGSPDDLNLYQARLGILDSLGETPAIEEQLREMVDLFPEVPAVKQTLFSWLVDQGDVDAAEGFLRDLATTGDEAERENNEKALVQFVQAQKGTEAALVELERLIATSENPNLFRALRAGIKFDGGERDDAIAEVEDIIANAEPSDQTRNIKIILARMQLEVGNQVGTRALIEEVLAEDDAHVGAVKIKSRFLIDGDKASEAITLLRLAADQAPQDAELITLMALAHERNGNRDLMGDLLARAAEISNRAPNETIRLASFLVGRNQFGPAEQALVESLRQNPGNGPLLSELGGLYIRMEKIPEASAVERSLRDLNSPQGTAAADNLQLAILRAQNRSEDIVAMINQLSRESSNKTQATVAIMRTHLLNDDIERARATIDEALVEDPENLDLKFAKSVLLGMAGDEEAGVALMQEVVEAEPKAVNVWLAIARAQSGMGDSAAAEASIDSALAASPENGNLRWAKAGYLERAGDIQGAIAIYEDLYDAGSSSLIAANNLASLLTSYQQSPEVIERAYSIARRLRSIPQPAFQDTYGWIAYLRGDLEDARAHMEPAAEGLSTDPLVQYHLARVYEALKRHSDAAERYELSLSLLGSRENPAMADAAERLAAVKSAAETEN